jgi:hypothetical protein
MTAFDRREFLAIAAARSATAIATVRIGCRSAQASTQPQGAWTGVFDLPAVAIHLHQLPDGKILLFNEEGGRKRVGSSTAFVIDIPPYGIASTNWIQVDNTQSNLYCAGHAFLPDGRLLVIGGHNGDRYFGIADVHLLEYDGGYRWTPQNSPMNAGRWYPSALTLPNGEVLVLSGTIIKGVPNTLPQVWKTNEGGGWRDLSNAARSLANYPRIHVVPDGRVILVARERITSFLDPSGLGSWTEGPSRLTFEKRAYGTSVMFGDGDFIVVGGATRAGGIGSAETLSLREAVPQWRIAAPMAFGRRHCNGTLLPDGKILITGGTSSAGFNDAAGAIYAAELWDPATGQWATMASASIPRVYHSTAMLLRDGRVLVAGGGRPAATNYGISNYNAEIFSPPYLFQGPAPVISSAPLAVNYGQIFDVWTLDAATVSHVRLISLGSVTHSFNMNQRIKELSFVASTSEPRLSVTMESNPNVLPPGHYMLFLLSNLGVPGVASIVKVT